MWSIICYAPHKAWQIFDKIFDVFVKLILSQIIIGWTLAITDTLTYGMIILSSNWVNVILCKIKNAGRYNFPTNFDLVKLSLTSHTVLGVVWCWSLTRAMIKISSEVPTGHSSLPSVCQIYCFLSPSLAPWKLHLLYFKSNRLTECVTSRVINTVYSLKCTTAIIGAKPQLKQAFSPLLRYVWCV